MPQIPGNRLLTTVRVPWVTAVGVAHIGLENYLKTFFHMNKNVYFLSVLDSELPCQRVCPWGGTGFSPSNLLLLRQLIRAGDERDHCRRKWLFFYITSQKQLFSFLDIFAQSKHVGFKCLKVNESSWKYLLWQGWNKEEEKRKNTVYHRELGLWVSTLRCGWDGRHGHTFLEERGKAGLGERECIMRVTQAV